MRRLFCLQLKIKRPRQIAPQPLAQRAISRADLGLADQAETQLASARASLDNARTQLAEDGSLMELPEAAF